MKAKCPICDEDEVARFSDTCGWESCEKEYNEREDAAVRIELHYVDGVKDGGPVQSTGCTWCGAYATWVSDGAPNELLCVGCDEVR